VLVPAAATPTARAAASTAPAAATARAPATPPAAAAAARVPATPPTPTVEGTLIVHADWAGARPVERLFVLLPPSYADETTRRYPVLCALDGRDLFDPALAAGGEEWTLDEILARRPAGVLQTLVVGVELGADATRAVAPPGALPDARGDSTLAFLVGAVLPFVAANYRVLPGRDHVIVLGVGNSAPFAAYAAWRRPDVFAGAIALGSPDIDAAAMAWTATPLPGRNRPWIWLEQRAAETPRPSSTDLVAALARHADVQLVVSGPDASRTQRLLAALVAWGRR
jgi:enterochelin esterase-like enzyme